MSDRGAGALSEKGHVDVGLLLWDSHVAGRIGELLSQHRNYRVTRLRPPPSSDARSVHEVALLRADRGLFDGLDVILTDPEQVAAFAKHDVSGIGHLRSRTKIVLVVDTGNIFENVRPLSWCDGLVFQDA